jgi:hypothetical protein
MGDVYRNELIRRLKQSRLWDALSEPMRAACLSPDLPDSAICELLASQDEYDIELMTNPEFLESERRHYGLDELGNEQA